jgi:acetylornithine deacetylase/succinyl-diaminopimelate desuccinylase-like protein
VILHSLEILKAQGWKDYAQLTVLFNADEEVGSGGSGETIAALADQQDVVLSCEPNVAKSVAKSGRCCWALPARRLRRCRSRAARRTPARRRSWAAMR